MSTSKTHLRIRALTEGAIFVAMAFVLSFVKLYELPNGGSLTPAMFPILLYALRFGTLRGLLAGFIFGLLQLLFDGAYMFYNEEKTMAKTSCNVGILESVNGKTVATCLMRSNSNFEMNQLIRKSQRISALLGVEHIVKDRSAAWEGDGTPLILRVAELYEAEFGDKPTFTQAHGGVEIGTILGLAAAAGKTIHAVNFGATSEAVHTTKERLHIPGMQQGYAWLQHVLANLD